MDTPSEELAYDDLTEVSVCKPELEDEMEDVKEAVPENKLTLDHLAESSDCLRLLWDCFTT